MDGDGQWGGWEGKGKLGGRGPRPSRMGFGSPLDEGRRSRRPLGWRPRRAERQEHRARGCSRSCACFRVWDDVDLLVFSSTSRCCGVGVRTRADVRGERGAATAATSPSPSASVMLQVCLARIREGWAGQVCFGFFDLQLTNRRWRRWAKATMATATCCTARATSSFADNFDFTYHPRLPLQGGGVRHSLART